MQVYWLISLLAFLVHHAVCQLPNVDEVYEPNPPTTHLVTMVVEYTPIGESKPRTGEFSIAVYGTVVPKTVDNFVKISKGVKVAIKGQEDKLHDVSYRGSIFHRIINGNLVQGGNVMPNIASFSVYGQKFDDENFALKHDRAGRVSMANSGKDTNASQFFIVTNPNGLKELDGKHVVFGQVVSGLDVLLLIQKVETVESKPVHEVKIIGCSVETFEIGDPDWHHAKYLEKLEKFHQGDKTVGDTLRLALGRTANSAAVAKGKDIGSIFSSNYLYIGASVVGLLYLVKKRRSIFSRSRASVVSVRNS